MNNVFAQQVVVAEHHGGTQRGEMLLHPHHLLLQRRLARHLLLDSGQQRQQKEKDEERNKCTIHSIHFENTIGHWYQLSWQTPELNMFRQAQWGLCMWFPWRHTHTQTSCEDTGGAAQSVRSRRRGPVTTVTASARLGQDLSTVPPAEHLSRDWSES